MAQQFKRRSIAFKADKVDDDGTFTGYGSVFDVEDSYGEVVKAGAFKDSLKRIKKSGAPLPVLWQHSSREPMGGYTELEEDSHGLKVEGFLLINEVARAKEAFALMKANVVRGLSIGFWLEDGFFNEKDRIYEIRKADLVEISVVTFPANPDAQIDGVKSFRDIMQTGVQPTPRQLEDHLRESGFSRTEAAAIVSKGYTQLFRGEPGGNQAAKQVQDMLAKFKL